MNSRSCSPPSVSRYQSKKDRPLAEMASGEEQRLPFTGFDDSICWQPWNRFQRDRRAKIRQPPPRLALAAPFLLPANSGPLLAAVFRRRMRRFCHSRAFALACACHCSPNDRALRAKRVLARRRAATKNGSGCCCSAGKRTGPRIPRLPTGSTGSNRCLEFPITRASPPSSSDRGADSIRVNGSEFVPRGRSRRRKDAKQQQQPGRRISLAPK